MLRPMALISNPKGLLPKNGKKGKKALRNSASRGSSIEDSDTETSMVIQQTVPQEPLETSRAILAVDSLYSSSARIKLRETIVVNKGAHLWKANFEGENCSIVVKALQKDPVSRNEMVIHQQLSDDPNVIAQLALWETETHYFSIMECGACDLLECVSQENLLDSMSCRTVFRQVCEAVAVMHSRGYAHLDLKPDNIFLVEEEGGLVPKVGDFGHAIHYNHGDEFVSVKGRGSVFYQAPELRSDHPCNPFACDIWSLAVLLHCLVTGCWPFAGKSNAEMVRNFEARNLVLLHVIAEDRNMCDILLWMLQLDPKDRPTIFDVLSSPYVTGISPPPRRQLFGI